MLTKEFYECLLIVMILVVLILCGAHFNLSKSDWAAWAQAVGSIAAIFGAARIADWQHGKQVDREYERSKQSDVSAAKLLVQIIGRAHWELVRYQRQFLNKHLNQELKHVLLNLSFANSGYLVAPTRSDMDFLFRSGETKLTAQIDSIASDINEVIDLLDRYTDYFINRIAPEKARCQAMFAMPMTPEQFELVMHPTVKAQAKLLVGAIYTSLYNLSDRLAIERDDILKKINTAFPGCTNEERWASIGHYSDWVPPQAAPDLKVDSWHHMSNGIIRWQIKITKDRKEWRWNDEAEFLDEDVDNQRYYIRNKVNEYINGVNMIDA